MPNDTITQSYWDNVSSILAGSGLTTPRPVNVNAPQATPTPLPWQQVSSNHFQPLDTRLGASILFGMATKPTQTPPPTQGDTEIQFIAQCPMIMFKDNISVRASSCGDPLNSWVDPPPLPGSPDRVILRWKERQLGGLTFSVDSAVTGNGSVLFADLREQVQMVGYKFSLFNCLNVERYTIEENVIKVDHMGAGSSSVVPHDVSANSVAYFYRYSIRSSNGSEVATSTLFRLYSDQVNFTEVVNGVSTGRLIAVARKQGLWEGSQWHECMDPTSPRGWNLQFMALPSNMTQVATVADVRVAIAACMTLIGHRNENRNPETGLDTGSTERAWKKLWGSVIFALLLGLICINGCLVFLWSGLRGKLQKIFMEVQGGLLPKRPGRQRTPPFHPSY